MAKAELIEVLSSKVGLTKSKGKEVASLSR